VWGLEENVRQPKKRKAAKVDVVDTLAVEPNESNPFQKSAEPNQKRKRSIGKNTKDAGLSDQDSGHKNNRSDKGKGPMTQHDADKRKSKQQVKSTKKVRSSHTPNASSSARDSAESSAHSAATATDNDGGARAVTDACGEQSTAWCKAHFHHFKSVVGPRRIQPLAQWLPR
jgi:hypothetical protein